MSINTKEQLRDYIHSIHDYIRNSGAGYGMNALKIFNVFYTLKLLENKMIDIGFNENFDWCHIKKKINNHDFANKVHEWIYDTINELRAICLNDNTKMHPLTKDIKNILDIVIDCKEKSKSKELQNIENHIYQVLKKQNLDIENKEKLKKIAYFIYFQLPTDLPKEFIGDMFIKIDNLSTILENKTFDIRGKIYEYFIGRDKTAMSDLGAYFTDRHLTNFIMDEINPVLDKNNNVKTMIDPFAGSGGMTLSYVSYLNQKYNKKIWSKNENYKNVYHYDMSEDVVKMAGIEFYSLIGDFPNYEKQFTRTNSFKNDDFLKYKYIITNPPYGGDKSTKSADTINRECIIDYNKKELDTLLEKVNLSEIDYKTIEINMNKDIEKGSCEFIDIKESIISKDNIEQFIEYTKNLFKKYNFKKYNFEENKENILKISRLCIQNILDSNNIKKNKKEQEKMQVNYNTCGRLIKEYSKKIVIDYETLQKNLIIDTIDNELQKLNKDTDMKYKQFESYKNELSSKNPSDKFIKDELNKFSDKESCSLILLMSLLDNDGVCAGVLKEGVFFDTNYSKLRGYLINNFNVSKVISISADQFENTTTKTSIIIFQNDGKKTEKIEFYDLDIEKYSDDNIIFGEDKNNFINGLIYGNVNIEPKNKISKVCKKLISTATFDELSKVIIKYNKKNKLQFDIPFSFNAKDYNKEVIVCGNDYELVKLSDICESKNGYAFKTSEYKDNGVPLITITHIKNERLNFNNNHYIEYNDIYENYEIQKNDLIISLTGKKPNLVNIALNTYSDKLYLNQRCAILRNFKKINYYYFLSIFNGFLQNHIDKSIGNGSNQENVSLIEIQQLKIPIPKSQAKIQEWVDKISKPYDKMNSNKSKINELEVKVKNRIKEICDNEDCDEVELQSICQLKDGYDFYRNEMDDRKKYIKEENLPLLKIGSDEISDYIKINKKYNNFIVNKNDIIIGTKGTCGKIRKNITEKAYHKHGLLKFNNFTINKEYIYYYLLDLLNDELIEKMSNKSVLSNMKKGNLEKLKIKIPKNKKLIQNLESTFQKIETLQNEMIEEETQYKQLIKELLEEALPSNKNVSTVETNNNDSEKSDNISEEEIDSHEEEIKHNIVPIKDIDYIEENGNNYSIDSSGQKDCLCYTTDANGKTRRYKKKNIEIVNDLPNIEKNCIITMLAHTSGRIKKNC
jgi:type I restriction enzyme S subunit